MIRAKRVRRERARGEPRVRNCGSKSDWEGREASGGRVRGKETGARREEEGDMRAARGTERDGKRDRARKNKPTG